MESVGDELKTDLGTVKVVATNATHIYVSSLDYGTITVNGVSYYLSAHIYKWDDGHWHFGPNRDQAYHEPHMRRTEPTGNRSYDPSYPAREKARTVLLAAVLAWIASNPAKIALAKVEDLQSRLGKRLEEESDLHKQLVAKMEEISDLREQLAAAENFLLVPKAS